MLYTEREREIRAGVSHPSVSLKRSYSTEYTVHFTSTETQPFRVHTAPAPNNTRPSSPDTAVIVIKSSLFYIV